MKKQLLIVGVITMSLATGRRFETSESDYEETQAMIRVSCINDVLHYEMCS